MTKEEVKTALLNGEQLQVIPYFFYYRKHNNTFNMECFDGCCENEYETFEDFCKSWESDFESMFIAKKL